MKMKDEIKEWHVKYIDRGSIDYLQITPLELYIEYKKICAIVKAKISKKYESIKNINFLFKRELERQETDEISKVIEPLTHGLIIKRLLIQLKCDKKLKKELFQLNEINITSPYISEQIITYRISRVILKFLRRIRNLQRKYVGSTSLENEQRLIDEDINQQEEFIKKYTPQEDYERKLRYKIEDIHSKYKKQHLT